jgi:ADP-heptose:LPS heptosyltransferase
MAAALKRRDPHCTVIFLTNPRTADLARCCPDIDEVYGEPDTPEELRALLASLDIDIFIQVNNSRVNAIAAYEAGIPVRIGSLFRLYNLRLCTHLVAQSRPFSGLNKRLLDLQFLLPVGIKVDDLQAVLGLYHIAPPPLGPDSPGSRLERFAQGRRAIILSPATITARAHQWPLESYSRLIDSLDPTKFQWFICGLPSDRPDLQALLQRHSRDANVTDLVGRLTLAEFVSFITRCDGLVAGSTGPLHLAAALGIHTLGLYQSRRTDIERWHPLGPSTAIMHSAVRCRGERGPEGGNARLPCPCIVAIEPERVARQVAGWFEPL